MASCKDCIHFESCKNLYETHGEGLSGDSYVCDFFKDQSRFVELPCKVGDTVYRLIHGTINEYKVVSINYYVSSIFTDYIINSKHLSVPVNFNFGVNAIGKIVFLSREEAEQALKGSKKR